TTNGSTSTAASFNISSASQSGNTVTITTSAASGFVVGEKVGVSGGPITGYNGAFVITSVNGNSFTYNASVTGLTSGSGGTAATDTGDYLWYLDYNQDGNIDVGNSLDSTPFFNNLFNRNGGHNFLA